ncbi:hypothetical protein M0805_003819 [Coniferiporia weirii]|nr:hypothetical protein M0805_003819 [Coniferiporia weirii]
MNVEGPRPSCVLDSRSQDDFEPLSIGDCCVLHDPTTRGGRTPLSLQPEQQNLTLARQLEMPTSTVTSLTQLSRPLSWAEKDIVKDALSDPNRKVYAAALVELRDETVKETGALALVHDGNGPSLVLVDLRGNSVWLRRLSANSKLERVSDPIRHCMLSDAENPFVVDIHFGDGEEAKKFYTKFMKLQMRMRPGDFDRECAEGLSTCSSSCATDTDFNEAFDSREYVRVVFNPARNDEERIQDRDRPLRRKSVSTPAKHSFKASPGVFAEVTNQKSQMQRASASSLLERIPPRLIVFPPESVEDPPDGAGESSTGRCSGSLMVPGSAATIVSDSLESLIRAGASSDTDTEINITQKTCAVVVGGKTYEVPDVTDELDTISSIKIGEGGFGFVRQGKLRNGLNVAVKRVKHSTRLNFAGKTAMKDSKRFHNEALVAMMCRNFRHPNILQFLGVAVAEKIGACLVFPWMKNKDCLEYVQNNDLVPRMPIIRGTVNGLAFLHEKGVVHGDIKAQNVLVSDAGKPIICDFGLARVSDEHERHEVSRSLQGAGNVRWKAIELLEGPDDKATKESDMWAFGMFSIEVLTGELPFPNRSNSASVTIDICAGRLPERPAIEECRDELWDLLLQCWRKESSKRPTAAIALKFLDSLC